MGRIKIPATWFDSKYREGLCISAYQLIFHLLGKASDNLVGTSLTRGTFIKISEYLENCYGKRKFGGSYYKVIKDGLKILLEKKIISRHQHDKKHGVLLVTFTEDFLCEIYPQLFYKDLQTC